MESSYSFDGIIRFLQLNWASMDMERTQWQIEKSEYQTRIAFLQSERHNQENLKRDLVRRIKMLEFALTQERRKHATSQNAQSSRHDDTSEETATLISDKTLNNGSVDTENAGKTSEKEQDSKFGGEQKVADCAMLSADIYEKLQENTELIATEATLVKEDRKKLRNLLRQCGYDAMMGDLRANKTRHHLSALLEPPSTSATPSLSSLSLSHPQHHYANIISKKIATCGGGECADREKQLELLNESGESRKHEETDNYDDDPDEEEEEEEEEEDEMNEDEEEREHQLNNGENVEENGGDQTRFEREKQQQDGEELREHEEREEEKNKRIIGASAAATEKVNNSGDAHAAEATRATITEQVGDEAKKKLENDLVVSDESPHSSSVVTVTDNLEIALKNFDFLNNTATLQLQQSNGPAAATNVTSSPPPLAVSNVVSDGASLSADEELELALAEFDLFMAQMPAPEHDSTQHRQQHVEMMQHELDNKDIDGISASLSLSSSTSGSSSSIMAAASNNPLRSSHSQAHSHAQQQHKSSPSVAAMATNKTAGRVSEQQQIWAHKFTLRSHFDTVRSVMFLPCNSPSTLSSSASISAATGSVPPPHLGWIVSASDDHTLKLWNLARNVPQSKKSAANQSGTAGGGGAVCSVDVEPLHTWRGHNAPVISLAVLTAHQSGKATSSSTSINTHEEEHFIVSGSLDGELRQWALPALTSSASSSDSGSASSSSSSLSGSSLLFHIDPYDPYDPRITGGRIFPENPHSDAIWTMQASRAASLSSAPSFCSSRDSSPVDNLVFAGSADQSLSIWAVNFPAPPPPQQQMPRTAASSAASSFFLDVRLLRHMRDVPLPIASMCLLLPSLASSSIELSSNHSNLVLLGHSAQNSLSLWNLETGQMIRQLFVSSAAASSGSAVSSSGPNSSPPSSVTCIQPHPQHPGGQLVLTGHSDRHIRTFDLRQSEAAGPTHQMLAHLDAVTALCVDSNGRLMASGSHDCSVRLWDLRGGANTAGNSVTSAAATTGSNSGGGGFAAQSCVQEIFSHRQKFGESVTSVAFHPNHAFLASAGADALIKVFV